MANSCRRPMRVGGAGSAVIVAGPLGADMPPGAADAIDQRVRHGSRERPLLHQRGRGTRGSAAQQRGSGVTRLAVGSEGGRYAQ